MKVTIEFVFSPKFTFQKHFNALFVYLFTKNKNSSVILSNWSELFLDIVQWLYIYHGINQFYDIYLN